MPVEDPEHLEEHYSKNNHINAFDVDSFDYLRERGYTVITNKYLNKRILHYGKLLENCARWNTAKTKISQVRLLALQSRSCRLLDGRRGARVMAWLVAADERASRSSRDYAGVICVVLKDPSCYGQPRRRVTAARVMRLHGAAPLPQGVGGRTIATRRGTTPRVLAKSAQLGSGPRGHGSAPRVPLSG